MENNKIGTVTLYLDNDETIECEIICVLPVNDKKYMALLPLDEADSEESPIYLYRFIDPETEDGDPGLECIEDDDEYEAVCDAYDEWLDTQEYEALDLDALGLDELE